MILSHLKIEMRMVEHQPPMSQGDLARAYGCHQSAMSKLMARIERGEHISPPVVARMAEALGCPVAELLPEGAMKDGEAA